MKLKSVIVSVVLLAVVSAVVFFARRETPPPSADSRIGQPVVSPAVVEKAAKLRIADQGKTVSLARQSDGTWRVVNYYDLPADFSKLSTFVSSLTEAKTDQLVTSRADRIARLEFKDTKIELLDAADKPLWSLTLGKTPETGGGRFIRFDDEPKAYRSGLNAWLDPDAKNWANPELLNVKPEDVAKIEVPFAEGAPVTVSRVKKDDAWVAAPMPPNQKIKADKVSSLLSSIGNIRFSDTNDLADPNVAAAKAHQRVFKLTTFDGKTYTVALGRKPEEKKLKAPTATTDGKSGPAALGSVADVAKKDDKVKESGAKSDEEQKPDAKKPLAPEYETMPAGPVFAFITSSDPTAPVNALMQKRAFQISDYTFTGLPQKPDELFEPLPATPITPPDASNKADEKKPEPKSPTAK
jgi:hypothetical protein